MGLQRVQHDLMTNTSKLLQATGLELDLENSGVNKTYATLQLSKSVLEVFVGGRRETLVSLAFCRGP